MDNSFIDDLEFSPLVKQMLEGSVSISVIDGTDQKADDTVAEVISDSSSHDPQEEELANALIALTQKYGKFNEDGQGVWAGYKKAKDNKVKDIGVKCSNCALYEGGDSCKIIAMPVEPDGKCRFAIIHDGIVNVK